MLQCISCRKPADWPLVEYGRYSGSSKPATHLPSLKKLSRNSPSTPVLLCCNGSVAESQHSGLLWNIRHVGCSKPAISLFSLMKLPRNSP